MMLPLLKAHTQDLHQRVEQLLAIMADPLPAELYHQQLRQLYRLYNPLEARLSALPLPDALGWPGRLKAPLLEQDLSVLRLSVPDPLPAAALPELPSVAHALGCLYVLEGSTLGGQLIGRHLSRQLQLTAEHGAAFFNSYGVRVGPMWKAFGQVLEQHAAEHGGQAEMLTGALQTFHAFESVLMDAPIPAGAADD
ncbi:biliverdin-producing heme oxygenase [Deinococcus sonorensis]|uniref:Biliverdin-producing heme oxygenase n=2 Tax=Deinococcus sonorensis TaxID=309891 RepID=A0AAU7UG88_9DEIO